MSSTINPTKEKSLEESSSWYSYLFFFYLDTLFSKGYRKTLELSDLGATPEQNRSDVLYKRFEHFYEIEKKNKPKGKRSLWNILWKTVGYWRLFVALALFGFYAALLFGPVMILTRLVKYFEGVDYYETWSLWLMVALLFVFPMIASISLAHSNAIMSNIGAQVRNTLINIIYRKALVISPYSKQSISTGRILTMFSDDTNQIRNFLFFANNSAIAPFQIGACLYLIYEQVGVATFVGLGYSVIVTPITGIIFKIVFAQRSIKMTFTDARVKLMNEVLNGIRIIKYYAWEGAFVKKIMEVRDKEIYLLRYMGYLFNSTFAVLLLGAPQTQTVLIFFTYIALGNTLDSATAFTTLTLFGLMTSPFIFLPFGLQQYSQSIVSTRRIMEFLELEDLEEYIEFVEGIQDPKTGTNDVIIQFDHANLSWTPKEIIELADVAEQEEAKKAAAAGKAEYVKVAKDVETTAAATSATDPSKQTSTGLDRAIYTLTDVNLTIKKGQLVGIVGTVGSGKSSILNALLGEMHKRDGALRLAGNPTIAFCDQRPWIVNATVKDNILFGKPYDADKFQLAIQAACMMDDLKILPAGIQTEIGERGINLSGGQKARVALARAVYQDADIYLLDDPLSAVDAHVGEHLFRRCIKEVLKGKTVLLVTHHLQVLPQCDQIVIIEDDGTIKAEGSYHEILSSGIDVEKYLAAPKQEEVVEEEAGGAEEGVEKVEGEVLEGEFTVPTVEEEANGVQSSGQHDTDKHPSQSHLTSKKKTTTNGKEGELIAEEKKDEGDVPSDTYWTYVQYGGVITFGLTIFTQIASQVLSIEANFWLTDWGKETTVDSFKGDEISYRRSFHWLNGYAGMQMASIAFLLFSRTLLTAHRTQASYIFHNEMLQRVLYFPIAFFDTTPIGRIINRFSQDMATLDEDLAQTMSQVISMGSSVLGSIGAIAGSTKGVVLILFIPICYLYYKFNTYFRKSNTAIARIEAISRSPIYADFTQTLSGTTSIRAYKQQTRFIGNLEALANANTVPGVLQQIASQWLSLRLDFLGALIMVFMGALAVGTTKDPGAQNDDGFIPAGYLALGLSYSIQITSMLKMAVRVIAQMEAQFNSVERVRQYITTIPVEEEDAILANTPATPATGNATTGAVVATANDGDIELGRVIPSKQYITPPENWPTNGAIEFHDVQMRYRDGPLVLKGVSFKVSGHEKIGIAGRTGCGKSSLMVALFRIEELASGSILIDGVDIARLPLQYLRKHLCIIPQDPVMFSASVRFNLDPFNESSNEQVWQVLQDVNMKEHVLSLPHQLEELVAEGGDNFSAGQRQLICIARALLRKPKILIMDEATASIDSETDQFIQTMIRVKFKDCTILTIAHRLHTVIDYDKILVLDAGKKAEFDGPQELLQVENGAFRGLWERHLAEGGVPHTTTTNTSNTSEKQ